MKYLALITTVLYSCLNVAAIPAPQTELDIHAVAPVSPEPTLTPDTVAKFIPTNLNSESTNEDLLKEVGKKTIRAITKSDFIKQSSLGKTADTIKESTSTEIGTTAPKNNDEIQHKVKFSLDPYKAEARMRYTGFVNCSAFYDVVDQDLKVEITEQIDDTSVRIQHSTTEQNSTLLLGWTW